jgi:hypothetical protein
MTSVVQVLAIMVSAFLLLLVLDLVRRGKLREEYSLVWIACAGALLILSIWRDLLHAVARWLDVHYPPAVLLLILILFVFIACLHFSVVVSRQRAQIERLVEDQALLAARLSAEGPAGASPVRTGDGMEHEIRQRDGGPAQGSTAAAPGAATPPGRSDPGAAPSPHSG